MSAGISSAEAAWEGSGRWRRRDNPMKRLILAPVRLVATLAQHRFLILQLAWRAFSARHAGSFLGWLWTPLSTAIQFALYVVVFSAILQIKLENLGMDLARRPTVGFGVFLMVALVPYLALSDAVTSAAELFRSNANLVQRVRFPAEVLVLGHTAGVLLHHVIAAVLVVMVCGVMGHVSAAGLGWICLAVLLWSLWIVGLSLVMSVTGAAVPDLADALKLILQVGFYAAPIVYPLSFIKQEVLLLLVRANPLTPLVGAARAGLLGLEPPPTAAVWLLVAGGVVLVAFGAAVLERNRDLIPDLV